VKFSTIVKIHKYRGLYEGHHFILMVIEVHNTLRHDMDHFNKECVRLFHSRRSKVIYPCLFCIQFFRQHVTIAFQHALTFAIKKKIALAGDACSRPPIIIKFHDLHASGIRRAWVK
jgi:hypothetical protein